MDWAKEIFSIENRDAPTRFVRRLWRAPSSSKLRMISIASPLWGLVFEHSEGGGTSAFLHGPETAATTVDIPQNVQTFGILFDLGTCTPCHLIATLTNKFNALPIHSNNSFSLFGRTFEIPTFENSDVFVHRLIQHELLFSDATVGQALLRQPIALTDRTIQRRFMAATGMTYGTIRQFDRAERAADLLGQGTTILDVVEREGFSDQAHLTRSLKKYLGKTPGDIQTVCR